MADDAKPNPLHGYDEETQRFIQLVTTVSEVYRPDGVLTWLSARNRHLDFRTPRDLMVQGGSNNWAQLLNEADRLAGGNGW